MGSIYLNGKNLAIGEAKSILDLKLAQTPPDQRDNVRRDRILQLVEISNATPIDVTVDLDKEHPDLSHLPLQLLSQNIKSLEITRMEGIISLDGFPITSKEGEFPTKNDKIKSIAFSDATVQSLNGLPSELSQIEDIKISNSNLESIDGFPQVPKLMRLDFFSNPLKSLKGLPPLPSLRDLHLYNNNLEDLDGLNANPSAKILVDEPHLRSLRGLHRLQFFDVIESFRNNQHDFSLKSRQLMQACIQSKAMNSEACDIAYAHMTKSISQELEQLELPMIDFDRATKSAIYIIDEMKCETDRSRLQNSLQIYDDNLKKRDESNQIKGNFLSNMIKESYKMKCDVDL